MLPDDADPSDPWWGRLAERVTAGGQLQLPGPAGSVPVKSTRIRSPAIVTATRIQRSSSVTPSPSSASAARGCRSRSGSATASRS